jgi:tetratricopeptide (TPR) repeat protein
VSAGGAADRFWSQLRVLHQAAGKPTLERLVRLGLEQHPAIPVSDSTINDWLNCKAVPTGRKNERYLRVLVAFLQATVTAGTQYEPLPLGEWGMLLQAAQTERAQGKKTGRPRLSGIPAQSVGLCEQRRAVSGDQPETGLAAAAPLALAAGPAVPFGENASVEAWRGPPVPIGESGGPGSEQPTSAVAGYENEFTGMLPDVLTGRDGELAILAGLVKAVAAGHGSAVLVEGEPGIGKSVLVRTALAGAADEGCQVSWGTCDELDQVLPLQPLLDGLHVREPSRNPRRAAIVRILRGEVTGAPGIDASAVLAEQLLALIAEHCAAQPAILVVDDLQWADQATITLWARLARSARQMRLLLIGMTRPVPKREEVQSLRRAVADATRIRLTGLTAAEVSELMAGLVGGEPDGHLRRLAEGAAGNPLYVTELVAALMRSGMVTLTVGGAAAFTAGSVPGSLSAAIADRLGFVAPPVRQVLRAAALLGVDFAVPDLAIVLGRSVCDLAPLLDEACAAGVLAASGQRFGFRHALIRAALYEQVSAPVRSAWHREAGRALAEAGAPADRVARQLLQAADGPPGPHEQTDQWMLDWVAAAADQLVSQAPAAAAQLLDQAVAASPAGTTERDWLESRHADALYRIGDRTRAEQVANHVLEHAADPDVLVDLHGTLAQCRMRGGAFAASLAALDRALASPGLTARHRARLLVLAARTHFTNGDIARADQVASSALAAAREANDDWAMGWALNVLVLVAMCQRRLTNALQTVDQALTVTQANPALTDLRLLLQINKAVTLGDLDQYEEALATARQAQHLADHTGTAVRLAQAHGAICQLLFQTGRWDEALAEVTMVPEDLKESAGACCELAIAAVISFHRGEIATARRYLAATAIHAKRIGHRSIGLLAVARSLDREHDGQVAEALAALTDPFDCAEELEDVEELLADAIRLAIQAGDLGTAQSLADRAALLVAGSDIPHRHGNALYCQGLLHHDVAGLLAAAKYYDSAGTPLLQAKALEAAGGEFAHTGREQSRAAFDRAMEIYASLGATVDITRISTDIQYRSSLTARNSEEALYP